MTCIPRRRNILEEIRDSFAVASFLAPLPRRYHSAFLTSLLVFILSVLLVLPVYVSHWMKKYRIELAINAIDPAF
jgi:hypothetical protein